MVYQDGPNEGKGSVCFVSPAAPQTKAEAKVAIREENRARARVLRGSEDPFERKRAALLERVCDLQDAQASLKAQTVDARMRGRPSELAALERQRIDLVSREASANRQLADLRAAQRAHNEEVADRERIMFLFRFYDAALRTLDAEALADLQEMANEVGEDGDPRPLDRALDTARRLP